MEHQYVVREDVRYCQRRCRLEEELVLTLRIKLVVVQPLCMLDAEALPITFVP